MTYQISSQIPIFVKPFTLMKNMTPQFYGVIIVRCGLHRDGSPQNRLGDIWTCEITLASAYVLYCLSVTWLQL